MMMKLFFTWVPKHFKYLLLNLLWQWWKICS
jgi:hypothetical protein